MNNVNERKEGRKESVRKEVNQGRGKLKELGERRWERMRKEEEGRRKKQAELKRS